MNLTELRTFLAIIETGSLVRASDVLNVTQSTVTARLKALEDEIGQRLVNRQKSGASLTPAGVRLQRYAATINDLWQQARQETGLPDGMQSVCNMACHPDLWPDLGAKLFDHIRTTQPHIAISIWTGGQHDLAYWLDKGLIDLALTYWPSTRAAELTDDLKQDRLVLVSTNKHSPVRSNDGYVFVEAGDDFGRAHAAAYPDEGSARISFGTARLGLDHLLKNGGSAYLPDRLVAPYLDKELHQRHDAPAFTRQSYMVSRSIARARWPWFDDAVASLT